MDYRKRAYTKKEIEEVMDSHMYVKGNIPFTLGDLISHDLEEILDLAAERLVNSISLMDIDMTVVGTNGELIILEVSGDVSEVMDTLEYDDVPSEYDLD